MNIALIGFRGSGKSTVGQIVSDQLNRDFVDVDDYIESKTNLSIQEIFALCGEAHFRVVESQALNDICKKDGMVIATGGGVVLKYKNIQVLKRNSFVIYLDVSPEIAYKRITADKRVRPKLTDKPLQEEIHDQYEKRLPYYENAKDVSIDTTDMSVEQVAEKIIEFLKFHRVISS